MPENTQPTTSESAKQTQPTPFRPDRAIYHGADHDNPNYHPYRPIPDPKTGALIIDPDIVLKARQFNLTLSFFYSSKVTTSSQFGVGRSASFAGVVESSGTNGTPTVTRGDFRAYPFSAIGSSGGITTYIAAMSVQATTTLSFDGTNFTEYFNDGMQLIYTQQVSGGSYQLAKVKSPTGLVHTYTYGTGVGAGLLQNIVVPGGNQVTFLYTSGAATSLLQTVEDWANRLWTFQYDAKNDMTTMISPLGCQTKYTWTLPFHGIPMLEAITDPQGYTTSYTFNSNQQVTQMSAGTAVWTYAYNQSLSMPITANVIMTSPSGAVTTTTYDTQGNIGNIARPEGYTSSYAYDQVSFLQISETIPAGTTSMAYDQNLWLPLVQLDALGFRTSMQYDSYGNLTTYTAADGGVTTSTYYGTGATHLLAGSTDPIGRVSVYSYTSDGLLLSATDPRNLTTTYSYDQFGNNILIEASDGTYTTLAYDSLNRLIASTDPLNRTTSYAYDNGDNRISVTDPTGAVTSYIYLTCLLQAVVNPLNQRTTYTYGRYNNMLTQTDALNAVTTWNYDNIGFLSSTQDALGNFTSVIYNAARQKLADQDQLSYFTTYTYDNSGRLSTIRDARNNVSTNVYNARADVIATIDALNNRTSYTFDPVDRPTSVQSPLGFSVTTVYDLAGQVTATVDQLSYRTSYQYDGNGNQTTVVNSRTGVYHPKPDGYVPLEWFCAVA